MTVDEAYKQLGLPSGKQHDGAIVRKSFYKLAQMYHPDKNPEGRVSCVFCSLRPCVYVCLRVYIYFINFY